MLALPGGDHRLDGVVELWSQIQAPEIDFCATSRPITSRPVSRPFTHRPITSRPAAWALAQAAGGGQGGGGRASGQQPQQVAPGEKHRLTLGASGLLAPQQQLQGTEHRCQ